MKLILVLLQLSYALKILLNETTVEAEEKDLDRKYQFGLR